MTIHAIVPVKLLPQAKSRLAPVLPPAGRRALVLEMLGRVLQSLQHPALTNVWLLSADPTVLAAGQHWGARPLYDHATGLNGALEEARATLWAAGAKGLLVVPADVPLITSADVAALVAALAQGCDLALVPDAAGRGTNALALRHQPLEIPFCFGPDSAHQHLAAAAARGLRTQRLALPNLALDIDLPVNLYAYRALVSV
ncbi:MAG: 2-phospho-L-lactate guanylyltransferase [Candidatus Viridilinea halotolerans]|uniref:Phosphoenolpyruvate guanylyltransferase n=1 Tax=Candidatus Viridilinea halotolerans TaxID=2491704 RepID=A0A426TV09_9CHLR|nr:MAG: 2-phospho-L-lactate guanylyltransferase [Candidatus Viridilinea halotolerans]